MPRKRPRAARTEMPMLRPALLRPGFRGGCAPASERYRCRCARGAARFSEARRSQRRGGRMRR
jgi:hypothetical protein